MKMLVKMNLNDCINYEREDNVIQIIPESSKDIVIPNKEASVFGKTAHVLINVLGECKLIDDFNDLKKKIKKYSHENMYSEMYWTVVVQLEVKIILAQDRAEEQKRITSAQI